MLEEIRPGAELADAANECHGHLQDLVPKANYRVDQRDTHDRESAVLHLPGAEVSPSTPSTAPVRPCGQYQFLSPSSSGCHMRSRANLEHSVAVAHTPSEDLHHLPPREVFAQHSTAYYSQSGRGIMSFYCAVGVFRAERRDASVYKPVQHRLLAAAGLRV